MAHTSLPLVSTLALLLGIGVAAIPACSTNHAGASAGGATGTPPDAGAEAADAGDAGPDTFQADLPPTYVAKVKNILVGLPPTDAEVQQVSADPKALATLIDGWMKTPEYAKKMMIFFELAFQQTQITEASFIDMLPKAGIGRGVAVPQLIQNIRESFARTALQLVAEGRPLSDAMTTKRLMMTPPLMELYAFLDTYHVDDAAKVSDRFAAENPNVTAIVQGTAGLSAVTLAESVDPTSPFFMHWYNPDVAGLTFPGKPACDNMDPITYAPSSYALHWLFYGGAYSHDAGKLNCPARPTKHGVQFTADDFNAWKMVTIRPPQGSEPVTRFYDIPALRTSTELVIDTPRPGFFSTPAFFANWSTNQSNQMRVTLNQALIVATGKDVDGTDVTNPGSNLPGLDATHAAPGTACFTCHDTLDPSRAILSSTWTYAYYTQRVPSQIAQTGLFAFQGVVQNVANIDDFAGVLAKHPLLPAAWAQKLCYYANSAPCLPDDPELLRVVSVFQSSNLSWNALVRELLSSPLTTNATPTKTTASAEVVAVIRRDHLCAALDNRLGLVDVCGLDATTPASVVSEIVAGLPSDGYGRGSTVPVLPNQPTLFFRAGLENICEAVAALVIDAPANASMPNAKRWSSATPASVTAAIGDFVRILMGLTPSDPRSAPAVSVLQSHDAAALQQGVSASSALKSTFTAACMAPSAAGIGM